MSTSSDSDASVSTLGSYSSDSPSPPVLPLLSLATATLAPPSTSRFTGLFKVLADQIPTNGRLRAQLDELKKDELKKDEHVSALEGKDQACSPRLKREPVDDAPVPPGPPAPVAPCTLQVVKTENTTVKLEEALVNSHAINNRAVYNEIRLGRGRLSGFPRPFSHVDKLPAWLCAYQPDRHGNMCALYRTFPCPCSDNVIVIALNPRKRTRIRRHLDIISHDRSTPVEVTVASDSRGGLTYLGSFVPENEWLSFSETNLGDIRQLLCFWLKVSDRQRVHELRIRWQLAQDLDGADGISYSILKYTGFNDEYFASLERISSDAKESARAASRQSSKRKRED